MSTVLDQPKTVIEDNVVSLLIKDVQKKFPDWTDDFARRGVHQMTGFLAACVATGSPLGPSRTVDEFWHAFILRTAAYSEFCDRLAGRFIHHFPNDADDAQTREFKLEDAYLTRQTTIDAIAAAGFEVDSEFWPELSMAGDPSQCSKCTQCHQGCHDSNVS